MRARDRKRLLEWYAAHHRDLPWRKTRDPYRVWLSEAMLQQTQVATATGYYERFLTALPTVSALATASLDDVLTLWAGLGYYRRARALHAAAAAIVRDHGGRIPSEPAALARLPGFGAYTAGAVASIAFGLHEPVVDGNVARVFARYADLGDPVDAPATSRQLWAWARAMVERERPETWNQALMELGALVCTPKRPRCDECPLARGCGARASGRATELPRKRSKRAPTRAAFFAVAARQGKGWWMAQRPARGLFAGLWEPPLVDRVSVATREGAVARVLGAKLPHAPMGSLEHVLSHRRFEVDIVRVELGARSSRKEPAPVPTPYVAWRRVHVDALDALALSSLARRILAFAEPGSDPRPAGSRAERANGRKSAG